MYLVTIYAYTFYSLFQVLRVSYLRIEDGKMKLLKYVVETTYHTGMLSGRISFDNRNCK